MNLIIIKTDMTGKLTINCCHVSDILWDNPHIAK